MPSLGIGHIPEVASATTFDTDAGHGTGIRRVSGGRRLASAGDWDSGNQALAISRGSRNASLHAWTRPLISWHAIVPCTFRIQVSHRTQQPPPNCSRLNRGYNEAPRGAH